MERGLEYGLAKEKARVDLEAPLTHSQDPDLITNPIKVWILKGYTMWINSHFCGSTIWCSKDSLRLE